MRARYPNAIVLLVEDVVEKTSTDEALEWMATRAAQLKSEGLADRINSYENDRGDGTRGRPRFLSVFEAQQPTPLLTSLNRPHDHRSIRRLGSGAYETLSGLPKAEIAGPAAGILVGLTECLDPKRTAEFNEWYDGIHAADVFRSPWYWSAQRFQKQQGDLPSYAALYESIETEPEAFKQFMKWPDKDPSMHALVANIHIWTFNQIAEW
ncbi:MAG: hypothetical protein R3A47_06775 [Polyangiales bacterium]